MTKLRDKPLLRHRWSHLSLAHRISVRTFNLIMGFVPFRLKYLVGKRLRLRHPPYSLLESCDVVVQIGSPLDTLRAGRSRGMYFALMNQTGRATVIIEPDTGNVNAFTERVSREGLENVSVVALGAWSEEAVLTLYFDPKHPAANFTVKPEAYDSARVAEFRKIEIPVDSVDQIMARLGIDRVDLVSITTNGAEQEILAGMSGLIHQGIPYICLARTDPSHVQYMAGLGYTLMSHDDRGYTFGRDATAP